MQELNPQENKGNGEEERRRKKGGNQENAGVRQP
jgi:hypothetical protein